MQLLWQRTSYLQPRFSDCGNPEEVLQAKEWNEGQKIKSEAQKSRASGCGGGGDEGV